MANMSGRADILTRYVIKVYIIIIIQMIVKSNPGSGCQLCRSSGWISEKNQQESMQVYEAEITTQCPHGQKEVSIVGYKHIACCL